MIRNRSVPTDAPLIHIFYADVPAAIDWLGKTFGFSEHYRYGDPVSGAQMFVGNSYVMLADVRARPGRTTPDQSGHRTHAVTIFVDNVDAHFERTEATGARIIEDLNEPIYGERQYAVEDLEGHLWLFSQHVRDADPQEWGATVSTVA